MRRTLALWLLLFGVYASTLGLDAFGGSDYGGDEPHYLLAAKSIVEDGDVDVLDEYASRAYAEFYPYELTRTDSETEGRLNEPHGVGFPLLIAPAYALGGAKAVELFLAAIAALGVALAYRLALRVAPDPWALGAALAVGLSPPLLAYGTAVYPELAAATALAGAALLALRLDDARVTARRRRCASCCSARCRGSARSSCRRASWSARSRRARSGGPGTGRWPSGASSCRCSRWRSSWRSTRRSTAARRPTPRTWPARPPPTRPSRAATSSAPTGWSRSSSTATTGCCAGRRCSLLAFVGLWWLWHSHRERVARAVPGVREIEVTAGLCAAALGAQLLVAAFVAPTMFGFWFPPRHLLAGLPLAVPLVAWGLRHAPRVGSVLVALTLVASAWLYADVRWGDGSLAADRPDAPFGPLTDVLPLFTSERRLAVLARGGGGDRALPRSSSARRAPRATRARRPGATRARYSG